MSSYRNLVEAAKTRYENGVGTQQELIRAELRLSHSAHWGIELKHKQRRVAAEINALQNLSPDSSVPSPAEMPKAPSSVSGHALTASLFNHPQLLAADALLEGSAVALRLAEKARMPDFVAELSYVGMLDPEEKRFQVGLGLNLPFDQRRRKQAVAVAAAERRRQQAIKQQTLIGLQARFQSLKAKFEEHRHVVDLYSGQLINLARKSLEAAERDYANGVGEFSDVALAIADLQDAEQRLHRHKADLFITVAELTELSAVNLFEPGKNNEI